MPRKKQEVLTESGAWNVLPYPFHRACVPEFTVDLRETIWSSDFAESYLAAASLEGQNDNVPQFHRVRERPELLGKISDSSRRCIRLKLLHIGGEVFLTGEGSSIAYFGKPDDRLILREHCLLILTVSSSPNHPDFGVLLLLLHSVTSRSIRRISCSMALMSVSIAFSGRGGV